MEDPVRHVEAKIAEIFGEIAPNREDPLQENLFNFIKLDDEEVIESNLSALFNELQGMLTPASEQQPDASGNRPPSAQENTKLAQEAGVKMLVQMLYVRQIPVQANSVATVIRRLAQSNAIPSRLVCITLLNHEQLKPINRVFWCTSFVLVKSIIAGVDYKGVREIMKLTLERCKLLSPVLQHSQLKSITVVSDLLELICDPSAALLPGYFIVNELIKLCPDYQKWPHWKISQLLTEFVENFQRAAQLLSIINRTKLRPVVEHSGQTGWSLTSWKLDWTTLKFGLKGSLPYANELLAPQPALLNHVLRQPYSKEMVCAMLDMKKTQKQRCTVLEEQLINLMICSLKVCHATDLYHQRNKNKSAESIAASSEANSQNIVPPTSTASEDPSGGPSSSGTASSSSGDGQTTGAGASGVIGSSTSPSGVNLNAGDLPPCSPDHSPCPCHHVSSLLIHFVLHQLINFPALVQTLHNKLKERKMIDGRDHLMWMLLQLLSGTLQKYQFPEFLPLIRLIEYLYPEDWPLPVPDYTDPSCVLRASAMCMLIHILRKAQTDNIKTPRALPPAFTNHNDLIQSLVHNPQLPHLASNFASNPSADYRISLLLNAFSTNTEMFHRPVVALVESIQSSQNRTVSMPGSNCLAHGATVPLSMTLLDSLTIHVKMSLIHNIYIYINKQAHSKNTVALAPALVETYARLLVYPETETIGIKQFITTLLPAVFKSQMWGILHALLEMFSHRIHHSPPHYRVQLLSTIHHMSVPLNGMLQMTQLHLCLESVALRLISGLGNSEVSSLTRFTPESKSVISGESEELNKVLVLTLARAIHVTGYDSSSELARWCTDFLKSVMSHTKHTWPAHTMQCFPRLIEDFYKQVQSPHDNQNLKKEVEEEYRKWKSMSNENDIIAHFSLQQHTSTLFLCLLFKMVLDTDRVPVEAYKVLERLGPRQLMSHVRTLCDFLVLEFSNSALGQYLSKCVDTMNAIIWNYHIVPVDRLMLCLALRTQEGSSEAQVCMFIIQLLLLRPLDLRNRVKEFVSENVPDHWNRNNWYEQHMAFHRKFPEKFSPESLVGGGGGGSQGAHHQTLPIYFTNVCLRFLPVLDIIIHRFLEVQQVHKRLEMVLEQLGALYKFHDHPITYLYNTLHYYETRLRESPKLKRQLVAAVVGNSVRPAGWALTEEYLATPPEDVTWTPGLSYYTALIRRLVKAVKGERVFPLGMEWRFNEFGNSGCHALHVTCVELLALPLQPEVVAEKLLDVVLKGLRDIPMDELGEWINAVAVVLTWMPESYWITIHNKIIQLLQSPELTHPEGSKLDVFTMMKLDELQPSLRHTHPALTIAIIHAFWHHSSHAQLGRIPILMKEQIRPLLVTESQLICVFQLVGPFLYRFSVDIARKVFDVTLELYHALAKVDSCFTDFKHQDAICDVLYHIKYMFTGDSIKTDLEGIIRGLRPDLQRRLRFVSHLNVTTIQPGPASAGSSSLVTANAAASTASSGMPVGPASNTAAGNPSSGNCQSVPSASPVNPVSGPV